MSNCIRISLLALNQLNFLFSPHMMNSDAGLVNFIYAFCSNVDFYFLSQFRLSTPKMSNVHAHPCFNRLSPQLSLITSRVSARSVYVCSIVIHIRCHIKFGLTLHVLVHVIASIFPSGRKLEKKKLKGSQKFTFVGFSIFRKPRSVSFLHYHKTLLSVRRWCSVYCSRKVPLAVKRKWRSIIYFP